MPKSTPESAAILEQDNLRKTRNRMKIIELLQNAQEPQTAEQIFMVLKAGNQRTSLSTVYRTCETLTKKGILLKSGIIDDGRDRYEFNHREHRHHAVCTECHKIIPIDECPCDFEAMMHDRFDFEVTGHKIEVFGRCRECREKKKEETGR